MVTFWTGRYAALAPLQRVRGGRTCRGTMGYRLLHGASTGCHHGLVLNSWFFFYQARTRALLRDTTRWAKAFALVYIHSLRWRMTGKGVVFCYCIFALPCPKAFGKRDDAVAGGLLL